MCRRHPVRPLILILATEIRLLLATPFFPLFRSNGSAAYIDMPAVLGVLDAAANPVSLCSRRRLRSSAECMWALARSATHRGRYRLQQLAPRGLASGPTYLASHLLCLPEELLPGALLRDRPALCCGAAAAAGQRLDDTKQPTPTSQSSMRVSREVTKRNGRHRHTHAASDCAILASRQAVHGR